MTEAQIEAYAHAYARWRRKHRLVRTDLLLTWFSGRGWTIKEIQAIRSAVPAAEAHIRRWRS